jgi:iron complex transport system ATP-binding protein
MHSESLITVKAGSLSLGKRTLDFPDLTVEKGSLIALVGRNGSGKSVWLRHLMGWSVPLTGNVHSLLWSQGNQIAWVNNSRESFADLWVIDVLLLGGAKANSSNLMDVLTKFNLVALKEQSIQTLSDGEWMRVRMARLFYHQPPLILMDEPTAHLDFEYRLWWEEWTQELISNGCSIVCATHDLQWASKAAHQVWMLEQGRIQLMERGVFHPEILIKKDK